ncbi:MAG: hypothetical protein O2U61_02970, partial [Candidatus Bathyarchaeota archaeon]|nr:hypothetical protein [Candidatus Bathyarchaeota archaeon]
MKRSLNPLIIISAITLTLPLLVSAHQPNVVGEELKITVTDPEISKAYYGELTGQPVHYVFTANSDFDFYVNILVPDIESSTEDYTVTINRDEEVVATLDPKSISWSQFDEPFGGDKYLMGPEYQATGQAGKYDIVVTSPDNEGKYVLAIGETESFSPGEITRTTGELVGVKKFFEKSGLAVLESPFVYGPA